jgi:hypothetical protein
MSAQHTPGPWKLDGAANTGDLDIIAPTGRITMIDCEFSEASEDVLTANACLIAAAPDLLAALQDLLSATDETYDNRHERQAAIDAIAKAMGGDR